MALSCPSLKHAQSKENVAPCTQTNVCSESDQQGRHGSERAVGPGIQRVCEERASAQSKDNGQVMWMAGRGLLGKQLWR